MALLRSRLFDMEQEKQRAEIAAKRKSQVFTMRAWTLQQLYLLWVAVATHAKFAELIYCLTLVVWHWWEVREDQNIQLQRQPYV